MQVMIDSLNYDIFPTCKQTQSEWKVHISLLLPTVDLSLSMYRNQPDELMSVQKEP